MPHAPVPPAAGACYPAWHAGTAPEPIEAAYRVAGEAAAGVALVPLATMVEELRGLADQLTEQDEALAAHQQTIAALHRRAEAAEAERLAAEEERDALRLRRAEVGVPPGVAGLWRRLRARFGGG